MTNIRVMIADDHGVLRGGLRALLKAEADVEVVGEASDGFGALRMAYELHPDVLLADISMPGPNGIEIAQELRVGLADCRVLILTMHEDEGLVREALQAGACGYIPKRAVQSDLIEAIRIVARGEVYLAPEIQHIMAGECDAPPQAQCANTDGEVTPTEIDALRFLAQGYTTLQIAERLNSDPHSVDYLRASIKRKLNLSTRIDYLKYARMHGLV